MENIIPCCTHLKYGLESQCPQFTEAEYYEYNEWLEQFGRWAGTVEHVVHTMTCKAHTDATNDFLFRSNLHSTK